MGSSCEHVGIGATEHLGMPPGLIPIVQVAFSHDKWWCIPPDMSQELYEKYVDGQDAGYTWDWGEGGRSGSWVNDGEETAMNRYIIDFVTMDQTYIDNQRKRSIHIVWVRPQDAQAGFKGEVLTECAM